MSSRRFLYIIAALMLAAAPVGATEIKVGAMDMQRAMAESREGKKHLEKLKEKLDKDREIIKQKEDEINKIGEEMNKQGFMLSETARADKEEKYRRLRRDLERYGEDKKQEFVAERNRITAEIYKQMMAVVKDFAKAEGFSIIMEAGAQTTGLPGGVIYFDEKIDITNKVIKLYDEKKAKEK